MAGFLADPENHKYKSVEGIAELVERLEAKLEADNGIIAGGAADVASRVVVTAGGNMAFFNALLAIADPGDEIILLAPYYFNHEMAVAMLNCRAVVVPLDANYQIDLPAVEAAVTSRTRAIVTISPNNPTGAVYPREALVAVNELCRRAGHLPHQRRGLRVFRLRRRRTFFARLAARARPNTRSRSIRCRRPMAWPVGGSATW